MKFMILLTALFLGFSLNLMAEDQPTGSASSPSQTEAKGPECSTCNLPKKGDGEASNTECNTTLLNDAQIAGLTKQQDVDFKAPYKATCRQLNPGSGTHTKDPATK